MSITFLVALLNDFVTYDQQVRWIAPFIMEVNGIRVCFTSAGIVIMDAQSKACLNSHIFVTDKSLMVERAALNNVLRALLRLSRESWAFEAMRNPIDNVGMFRPTSTTISHPKKVTTIVELGAEKYEVIF